MVIGRVLRVELLLSELVGHLGGLLLFGELEDTGAGVDPFHPRAIRASAGAIFAVTPAVVPDPADAIAALLDRGLRPVGTSADGSVAYDRHDWSDPTALVLGAESGGLPAPLRAQLDAMVAIPMAGSMESLSVGAAAAVVLFEIARRRREVSRSGG